MKQTSGAWTTATFVEFGVVTGVVAGLLEAASRLWLQSAGAASFDMRLTVLGWPFLWVAPLVYAVLFGAIALSCRLLLPVIGAAAAAAMARLLCTMLVFVSPVAASGRLYPIAAVLLSAGLVVTALRLLPKTPPTQVRLIRRSLPWFVAIVALLFAGVEAAQSIPERREVNRLPSADPAAPNILLIVLDTLRADHVSSYGYHRDTTPALTRVAKEGVQFDRAIATSSWTLPSHASLLTGHYPSRHGAIMDGFNNRLPTLGAALAERGYRTAAISANTVVFSRAHGFGPGFLRFDDSFYSVPDALYRTFYLEQLHKKVLVPYFGWSLNRGRRTADNVTASALEWIAEDERRPFFLMLNYFDMHDPYLPPQPWRSRFSTKPDPGGRAVPGPASRYTAEEIQDEIDAYDGAIAYADDAIGRLLDGLESRGLRDRTAIVVTSDHGESLGQHGRIFHGTSLYMEQIRVPLLVRLPGRVPAGVRIDTTVSHTSVPATLLEFAGGDGTVTFPGSSLSHLWSHDDRSDSPPAFSELTWVPFKGSDRDCGAMRSAVVGEFHLIEHATCEPELFHLGDRAETDDLANRSEFQNVIDDLRAELARSLGILR